MKPEKMPAGHFGWMLIDGENGSVTMKNALHNLSVRENGDNHEFSKGLLVGVVSMLMASGMDFCDACQCVWQHLPTDCHPERFPESWKSQFGGKIAKVGQKLPKLTETTQIKMLATRENCDDEAFYWVVEELEDNGDDVTLKNIAETMNISLETVKADVARLYELKQIEIIN